VSDEKPAISGSPAYYREKAKELLLRAEEAATEEARLAFIALAENWHRLAKQSEETGW